jgi:signal transduction histidine kinase
LSKFVTNANFDLKASEIKTDIIQFIDEYIKEIYLPDIPVLSSNLKINVNIPDNLKHIITFRPLEFTTFVDNFIQNAEKASANVILFSFEKSIDGNCLAILISDNGKGIPQENINRIFDLGFTTTNGSGIGLFNVKSVVQKMKGNISVRSEINKGSTFKIELQV